MRRIFNASFGFALALALGALISSCTGPAGPMGLAGTNGKDGANGINGKDANATCTQCHNSSNIIETKSLEMEQSKHFTGNTVEEATRTSCAPCHSSQGYLDVIAHNPRVGAYATSVAITDPSPVGSCYTCHKIHQNYDSTDLAFTGGASFYTLFDSTLYDVNEKTNLCAKCHQARPVSPKPNITVPTGTMTIGSYRYGPHHGPQGAIYEGTSGFMMSGSVTYTQSTHAFAGVSCADCHMGTPLGIYAGGHSLNMVDVSTGAENYGVCTTCHAGATSFDVDGKQTEIAGLFAQLETALDTLLEKDASNNYTGNLDIYDPTSNPDGRYKSSSTSGWTTGQKAINTALPSLTVTNTVGAALVNYQLIYADKSLGVHNYPYVKALIQNSLDNLP